MLPTFRHPFGKKAAPFEHRLEMCRAAFSGISPKVEIRDDEADVGGEGFTIELIRHLKRVYPQHRFSLALGSDNYEVRSRWKNFDEIERLVDVRFFGRKGWEELNRHLGLKAPFPKASSEEIRDKIANGESPMRKIPKAVQDYIREHNLYIDPDEDKKTAAGGRG